MKYVALTNENIDKGISELREKLKSYGFENKDIVKRTLVIEEILLKYQDRFGSDIDFAFQVTKKLRNVNITVFTVCPKMNPVSEEDELEVLSGMLAAQGSTPFVNYQNGENVITFILKQRKDTSILRSLLVSIVLGVVLGYLCMMLPDSAVKVISESIVDPLFGALMNVISCIAGPLIFLSVTWGIYGIGDVTSLEIIGKKMMGRFIRRSALLELIALVAILPMFSIVLGSGALFDFSYFYQLILDIVPSNIIDPFLNGNTLQIIFLAICFGLAALILGKKTIVVATFVEQVNFIVNLIMEFISGMISIFVFMSVFSNIINGNITEIFKIYKFFPAMIIACIIPMVISLIYVSVKYGISPLKLLKKQIPTYVIALTTASSAAAFAENIDCCIRKLGINDKLANCGIPIGQVVYAIGTGLGFGIIGLCVADVSGIEMTANWLLTLFIMSFILGIATPPIPGGSMAAFTVFAVQLGIPEEMVSLCVALSIVADFVATSTNLFCLQLELIDLSSALSMLDKDKLKN